MTKLGLIATVAFMLSLGVASQVPGLDSQPPTQSNQIAILITTLVGFASLIATQVFAIMREKRERRWDLEDRAAARLEAKRHAEAQRIETIATALELAKVSEKNREHLIQHIDENVTGPMRQNTVITQEALEKANNFNEKLEQLRSRLIELTETRATIRHIDEVSKDTNEKVTDIKGNIKHEDPPRRR